MYFVLEIPKNLIFAIPTDFQHNEQLFLVTVALGKQHCFDAYLLRNQAIGAKKTRNFGQEFFG
jgi:hypothetical protein